MKYIQVTIETSEAGIEIAQAKLLALGIEDVEIRDPNDVRDIMEHKETYEWDYIDDQVAKEMELPPEVRCYFPAVESGFEQADQVAAAMKELHELQESGAFGRDADLGSLTVHVSVRDDGEWKDKWKEYFRPLRVSKSIVVCPSWEHYDKKEGDLVIEIDPGMAFGTGTHETTSMCIELLEKYLKKGDNVLDAGCGSGILSIAAAMLGAGEVLGVDIDREAVRVASENLEKNGVTDVASAEYGDLTEGVDFRGDLVVANLMAELIVHLLPDVPACLEDGGIFLSSGILQEKKEMVETAFRENGFRILDVLEKGEWVAIAAEKERG